MPGPAGEDGTDGAAGAPGENAFTFTTANFTMPAVGGTVTVSVQDSDWASVGQVVYSEFAGYMEVTARPSPVSMTLENLGYAGNAAPGTIVPLAHEISPAGLQGPAGSAPGGAVLAANNGLDFASPPTVYTNIGGGPSGQHPDDFFVHRPGAVTDLAVVRWDGVTGYLVQNSPMLLTDSGDFQIATGDAKGANAVDLQSTRVASTSVASGANAVISGGRSNRASGVNSSIPGGNGNVASGLCAHAAGESCLAQGPYTVATGQQAAAYVHGQRSHAAGAFAVLGDCVFTDLLMRNVTTDATATELFCDGAAQRLVIGVSGAWNFHIKVIGMRSNGDCAVWQFIGGIKNLANVVTLIGSVGGTLIGADAGCSGTWGQLANVVVNANDVQDALRITVTGAAANTIRWAAHVQIISVEFP